MYIIYTVREVQISIHALREEGDGVVQFFTEPTAANFYPRPPRGGRPFQLRMYAGRMNFYPRPPRGGRQQRLQSMVDDLPISIHALREEGDHDAVVEWVDGGRFLSTPSARRATQSPTLLPRGFGLFLSTPSARRATRSVRWWLRCASRFLSTPSARRATVRKASFDPQFLFLSTPSARRATIPMFKNS